MNSPLHRPWSALNSRFAPAGVLCELTNPDGTMARLPEIVSFAQRHEMPVLSIEDLVTYRRQLLSDAG